MRKKYYIVWIAIFLIIILSSVFAPLLTKFNPYEVELTKTLIKPNVIHIMGTDNMGRDVFSRILYGGRVSLSVALISVVISTTIGTLYGSVSGYMGGVVDNIMMRILDTFLAIPVLVIMLAFQSIIRGGITSMIIIMGVTGWLQTARIVRSQVMSIKNKNYIKAARVLGTPIYKIMINHLLRNSLPAILVIFVLNCSQAVFTEVAMSFLGIGVPQGMPSWGSMLNSAQNDILSGAWWIAFYPGIFTIISMLSINFIGESIKEKLASY
ncbi:ABC transporter permease [Clostridium sp. Marseille-Q2269]|uniref:ABC transporter permease n=1 Tax=Clostridium sp. Marseille-Q2269 TaxID=2942205 RepID=UPI0020730B9B|nr:ABC transporter permease [Clostridium sp. Marseille-Q2269]